MAELLLMGYSVCRSAREMNAGNAGNGCRYLGELIRETHQFKGTNSLEKDM